MEETAEFAGGRVAGPESAFTFTGNWKEFLPIAITNLLLIIVTLGIYRFWAKARERRYLWSRTHFIDDRLEWTGTGLEMFIGFLLVMLILLPLIIFLQFGLQALIIRGYFIAALSITMMLYLALLYLIGVAIFRALRYRLSRTYWHGIRGGSDDRGWMYGLIAFAMTFLAGMTAWLLTPWTMTQLWNQRLNAMSFGPHPFRAAADTKGLKRRWFAIYLVVIAIIILFGVVFVAVFESQQRGAPPTAAVQAVPLLMLLLYLVIGLAALAYYAAYYRKVVGSTSLADLQFGFNARTMDWLLLVLGNIGLVIVTLGFGLMFIGYRNWSFAIRHLEASGEINLDTLTQSRTRSATDAEGLASAFDIGAI